MQPECTNWLHKCCSIQHSTMVSTETQCQYEGFNAVTYIEDYLSAQSTGNHVFFTFLNEVYNSESFLKGTSFLDLGSGPMIHRLAPASRKYSDITVSDLLESNLLEVKKWLRKDKDSLEWPEPYKWAAAAEKISDHTVIMDRLRNAVKHVVLCDVLQENPLLNVTKQYDVVQCTFVVDSAEPDNSSLKRIIKNVSNVVKPGGALVMINTLRATYWIVGEYKFPKMFIDKSLLEEALLEAGFEYLEIHETEDQGEFKHLSDTKGFILSTAFKKQ